MGPWKRFSEEFCHLNLSPEKSKERSFHQRQMFGRLLDTEGKDVIFSNSGQSKGQSCRRGTHSGWTHQYEQSVFVRILYLQVIFGLFLTSQRIMISQGFQEQPEWIHFFFRFFFVPTLFLVSFVRSGSLHGHLYTQQCLRSIWGPQKQRPVFDSKKAHGLRPCPSQELSFLMTCPPLQALTTQGESAPSASAHCVLWSHTAFSR